MWPRILVCIAEKQSRLKRLKNFSHRKMFLKMLFQMLAVCYPIALNLPLVVPCSKLQVIFKVYSVLLEQISNWGLGADT